MDTKKIRPVESGNDAKREKVRVIPIQFFDDFPGHPFYVKMDEEMKALMESIKEFGILTPLIARKKENERYEIIAGHRRKFAAKKLGLPELPVILRDMTRDEAIVAMVDSNLHRERILPSEKAYAYKMKMEARKRQGSRTDLTSTPVESKLRTNEELGAQVGESREQIRRYIRLTELIPDIMSMVDEKKIALRPAVEISYLPKERQDDLVEAMEMMDCTPSHAQTLRMKKMQEEGSLSIDDIYDIMGEEKPNQKEKIVLRQDQLKGLIPKSVDITKRDDYIINALKHYKRFLERQKEQER